MQLLRTKQQPFGVSCWSISYHLKAFLPAKFQAENDAEIQAKEKAEIQAKKKSNIHNLYLSKHYAMYDKTRPFKGL